MYAPYRTGHALTMSATSRDTRSHVFFTDSSTRRYGRGAPGEPDPPAPRAARRRAAIGTSPQELDAGARQGLGPAVWRIVDRSGITPNAITILGFLGICGASWLALERFWVLSSLLFVASGLVDSLDGLVARHQGRVTRSARSSTRPSTAWPRPWCSARSASRSPRTAWTGRWPRASPRWPGRSSSRMHGPRGGPRHPGLERRPHGRPERLVIVGAGLFLGAVGDVLPVLMCILAASA